MRQSWYILFYPRSVGRKPASEHTYIEPMEDPINEVLARLAVRHPGCVVASITNDWRPMDPEKMDFGHPEDVLIEVVEGGAPYSGWKGHAIENVWVIQTPGIIGAASYDQSYGGGLDWTIVGMVDEPREPGFYMVEGITGTYHQGDGWSKDDDMDFVFTGFRKATPEEVADYDEA